MSQRLTSERPSIARAVYELEDACRVRITANLKSSPRYPTMQEKKRFTKQKNLSRTNAKSDHWYTSGSSRRRIMNSQALESGPHSHKGCRQAGLGEGEAPHAATNRVTRARSRQ